MPPVIPGILALLGMVTGDSIPAARRGDIFAANIAAHTVSFYDGASGRFKGIFVSPGSGGLRQPTGLAFGPDGDLYVSSAASSRILRYDGVTGAFRDVFIQDTALGMPFSIVFGPDGALYVSSGNRNTVTRIDGATGRRLGIVTTGTDLLQPIGLRFDRAGRLLVANSGKRGILRIDPAGGAPPERFITDSLSYPSDVAIGQDGTVYVSDANRGTVLRFDGLTGRFLEVFATIPDGGAPVGLAFDGQGRLVIGDFGKSRLFRAGPDRGRVEFLSAEGLRGPENLAIKP
jgi:DNA-binding beta-propeller fold protein YncE